MILINILAACILGATLCVSADSENLPSKTKNEQQKVEAVKTLPANSARYARSFAEPWAPSAWNPYIRSPLYTWWAAPRAHESSHSIVQSHPLPYHHIPHYPIGHSHHHHSQSLPVHSLPLYHSAPLPATAPLLHHGNHHATYVAANLGAVHVAPLLGHTQSVVSTNLLPVPAPAARIW